jgi:hypothetical protein
LLLQPPEAITNSDKQQKSSCCAESIFTMLTLAETKNCVFIDSSGGIPDICIHRSEMQYID